MRIVLVIHANVHQKIHVDVMKTFKGFIAEDISRDRYDTKSYIFSHYATPALILSSTALE